jgi:hypothetical protein
MVANFFLRRFHWFNLPVGLLLTFLQRSPALRVASALEEWVMRAPLGAMLRPAIVGVTTLGAIDSMAGATRFVISATNPIAGKVGQAITPVTFTYTGTPAPGKSFRVIGSLPPGLTFIPAATSSGIINSGTPVISGTPTTAGSYSLQVIGYENLNASGDTNNVRQTISFSITAAAAVIPVFSPQPGSRSAAAGGSVTLTGLASGSPTYAWQRDGTAVAGATSSSLVLNSLQPAQTGIYTSVASTTLGSTTSNPAIVGLTTTEKLVGTGEEFPNIFHAGTGFTYDQILLGGSAAAVTADAGQILRMSFIDVNDDIVQVEVSGPGTVSVVLYAATGPAAPVNYNQAVNYMKGHAGIVLSGATADTNLSIFSVGRANAANQNLFRSDVAYDGFASLAYVAILSADGQFGGLRAANASFFATKGLTGVYAPGVRFNGPVFVGDISASDEATPVLQIGGGDDVRITGGDLFQINGRPVQVSGITLLKFAAGSSSHGALVGPLQNEAVLMDNGTNVTAQIVSGP